jgi:hypothetical protein
MSEVGAVDIFETDRLLEMTTFVEEVTEFERGYARGPERELLSALLFDGIQSYLNYANSRGSESRSRFREAYAWIHKKNDNYVFSFESVCEALGIDPDYLRVGLANVEVSDLLRGKRRN